MTPYLLAGALIAGAAGAYTAQEWRYGAKLADIEAAQATALSEAYAKANALQNKINTNDRLTVEALDAAKKTNDALRRKYANRLRIKATCVPTDPAATGVDDAGTAELSPDTGLAVFDLRAGVIQLESQLSGLQSYVRLVLALNDSEAKD